ncbi:MAG: hypothetical protein JWQ32_2769 [Marmoricola sp.]|nr:hypothetical protein [Marmoricola sp.]
MAGSHRAERPATRSRKLSRAVWIAVIVALIAATYIGAHHIFSSAPSTDAPKHSVSTRLASPTASPSTPAATPTPSPTTSAKPAATKLLPRVKPTVARRLTVAGVLGATLDNSIEPKAGQFTPASTVGVARWGSRGLPSSPGSDTVYIVGKVDGPTSAFRRLGALHAGSKVVLRTDTGLLTYTVRSVGTHRANGLLTGPAFRAHVPGRLILIGIEYSGANRTGSVLVVTAQLSAAKRT